MFRHQLVHDAIYQHVPPAPPSAPRGRGLALMAAGADRLDVADQLMLGANAATSWQSHGCRRPLRSLAQAPSVTVELLRCAEALLPRSQRRGNGVDGGDPGIAPRREGGRGGRPGGTRPAARRRGGHGVAPRAPGCAGAPEQAAEVITVAHASLAGPARLRPAEQVLVLAQQSWALTCTATPAPASRLRAGTCHRRADG